MIRCAIVGAGTVVEDLHLSALRGLPGVELAALCEMDRRRAREFQDRSGIPRAYSSLEGLLAADRGIDFVDIATPAHTHYDLTKQALEAGLHVLVEKPLALSARQGSELDLLARGRARKLCVLQTYRYRTPMLQASELLQAGVLGTLTKMSITCRVDGDPFVERRGWDWAEKQTMLLLYELAVHYVDLAVQYGGPLATILGFHATTEPGSGRVTAISALLEHASGLLTDLDFTVLASSRFIRIELFGSRRDVSIKLFPEGFVSRSGTVDPIKEIRTELRRTSRYVSQTVLDKVGKGQPKRRAQSHFRVMAGFVEALEHPELDPPVTAASVAPTLAALDALHARLREPDLAADDERLALAGAAD